MYKILINILLLNCVFSQNISGTIQNESGKKIEGVNIFIPVLNIGTSSDTDGMFYIRKLPSTSLAVHFTMIGYESQILIFKINSEPITITMLKSVIEMEPIVISGGFVNSQDKSAFKISSIEIKNLKFSGDPSLNISLANEPGIEIIKMGSSITKPVIRGLTGNRVMILYQGAKTANQAWGEEHGVFIPEEGIEKIEIIKGPASLLYGSEAMGGIINFIPKKALIEDKQKTKISFSGFSNSTGYQSSLINQKKRKSWFHTFGLGYQNYADYIIPNGQFANNSRYTNHYVFGNWGVSKTWGIVRGAYSSSYTLAGLIDTISSEQGDRKIEKPWQEIGDHFITLENIFWIKDWTIQPFISYQLNNRKEFEDEHNDEYDDEHDGEHNEEDPALDMSLRTARIDLKSFLNNEDFNLVFGIQGMYQTNTNYGEEILVLDAFTNDIGIYTFLNKKLYRLQIQAGARGDRRNVQFNGSNLNFLNYTYSLGSTYNFKNQVYRFNFAKGFRAPNLYELSADGEHHGANRYEKGNSNLISEDNLEVDFSIHIHSLHFSLDLAVFNNNIQNYIYIKKSADDYSHTGLPLYEHYQHNAQLNGGEFGIDIHPHFSHNTHIKFSYSMVRGTNFEMDEPLPMIPADHLYCEIIHDYLDSWIFDKMSTKLDFNYYFEQSKIAENEEHTDAYFVTNIGVKLNQNSHELSFHINNLFNTEYTPHISLLKEVAINEPGRNFVTKYSYNF